MGVKEGGTVALGQAVGPGEVEVDAVASKGVDVTCTEREVLNVAEAHSEGLAETEGEGVPLSEMCGEKETRLLAEEEIVTDEQGDEDEEEVDDGVRAPEGERGDAEGVKEAPPLALPGRSEAETQPVTEELPVAERLGEPLREGEGERLPLPVPCGEWLPEVLGEEVRSASVPLAAGVRVPTWPAAEVPLPLKLAVSLALARSEAEPLAVGSSSVAVPTGDADVTALLLPLPLTEGSSGDGVAVDDVD